MPMSRHPGDAAVVMPALREEYRVLGHAIRWLRSGVTMATLLRNGWEAASPRMQRSFRLQRILLGV